MPARLHPRASTPYQQAIDVAARGAILSAWANAGGKAGIAAKALGISVTTLYREIRRLGLAEDLEGCEVGKR